MNMELQACIMKLVQAQQQQMSLQWVDEVIQTQQGVCDNIIAARNNEEQHEQQLQEEEEENQPISLSKLNYNQLRTVQLNTLETNTDLVVEDSSHNPESI